MMNQESIVKKINDAYNLLEDDISRYFFENRINFSYTISKSSRTDGSLDGYEIFDSSRIPELEDHILKESKILISGAGFYGEKVCKALKHAQYKVVGFLDNDPKKQGTVLDGIPIYSFDSIINDFQDCNIIVANPYYGLQFYKQICAYGFPQKQIYYSFNGDLISTFGEEYFDIPKHKTGNKEVFVDVGALNGDNSIDFIKWCNGEYEKIYTVEPSRISMNIVKKNMTNVDRVEFVNLAVGDKQGEIDFYDMYDHPGASSINKKSNSEKYTVKVDTIDNIVKNSKTTFIKLDVEGEEIAAINGAINTIKREKPILAISVYHNEDDIVNIPILINDIRQDYKFYLRHYSNKLSDLVLYCI